MAVVHFEIALTAVTILLVVGLGFIVWRLQRGLQLLREAIKDLSVQETAKELQAKEFQTKPSDPDLSSVFLRFEEADKSLKAIIEREDRELNNIWAEVENLRQDLLTPLERCITVEQWRSLLNSRVPSAAIIKEQVRLLMASDAGLAAQLKKSLPEYLTGDDPLSGLLDLARMPFERINWIDALILPVSGKSDGLESAAWVKPFGALIDALGYSCISPVVGEMYMPDYHEVVDQRLSSSQRGTILATRERGYYRSDGMVRKAKVVISAGQS